MAAGQRLPEEFQCVIAGLSIETWQGLWYSCHAFGMGGPQRLEWPDGRCLIEQPAIVVRMFELFADRFAKEAVKDRGK